MTMGIDTDLRGHVYRITLERGIPPTIAELATTAALSEDDVRRSLERLAKARVLVLQPASGEILMVPPFSAVPTPFLVESARHTAYANCVWDALGMPIMLDQPAHLVSACGCCGESMLVLVDPDLPPDAPGVIHFAVPARRWWEDIVFT